MDKAGIGEMLRALVAVDGPAGGEGRVAEVISGLVAPLCESQRRDPLGNLIARAPGSAPAARRIMLAAHMDEIGLVVTKVDQGFLHVGKIGGVDPRAWVGQEVTVYASGPGADAFPAGLPGYIGSRPPHLLAGEDAQRAHTLADLRVDLGREATFCAGGIVQVGDRVAMRGPYTELLAGRVTAKSLDNRASVAAVLAALGYLAGQRHTWDVIAAFTAQEEFGARGATTAAFGVAPDLAIAIDVTFGETPGVGSDEVVPMDRGPAIGWGPNLHPGIVKRLRAAADALELPHVTEPLHANTGTDAWPIQITRDGIPTGLVSIPIRYMHSAVETVALADIDRAARLLAAFISGLDDAALAAIAEEI